MSLLYEIYFMILMNFLGDSKFLAGLALVCSSWSAVAVDVLYRAITVTSAKHATKLSFAAKYLDKTKALIMGSESVLACPCQWTLEIETILRACQGLKELNICGVSNVPSDMLLYPSLKSRSLYPNCFFQGH